MLRGPNHRLILQKSFPDLQAAKKRKLAAIFASTLLVAAVALTGCGGDKDSQQASQPSENGEKITIVFSHNQPVDSPEGVGAQAMVDKLYTVSPSLIVSNTLISLMAIGSTFSGLSLSTTKSARFPALIEPLLSSSKYAYRDAPPGEQLQGLIEQAKGKNI